MANIDNLNFKVIIDDKEFNKQIQKMEDEAKRFNTSMSNLLNIKKASQQWSQKDVDNNRRAWQAKVDEGRAQEKINREKVKTDGLQRKINAQIEAATQGYKSQSRVLQDLKNMALGYFSVRGASQLLSSLVRVTGEFELQKTTLAAMLGDLNAAEKTITKIQGLAVESPFQFKELTTYAKQLSAFSVPAEELYNTTKMLADISAGLGVGMDRIVLAYGQVRSAAFLRGQEVRQFTEAGIPILDELAKQFTELEGRVVSTTEVFDKISSRLVPFEMVAKVFKDMTSEGGKFYNMQEVQAETLKGKISNLKDAYEVMLNEIGKGQSENIKGAVDWARKLMVNYEQTGKELIALVATYGTYKTALLVLSAATGTFQKANHSLLSSLISVGEWIAKNPYALIAAGIAAIGYAIYQSTTQLESYEKVQRSLAKTQSDFTKAVNSERAKLETLYARLDLAKEGTEEYAEAKKDIYTQFASYISELDKEGVAVDNLASIYENLKTKIEESQQARFRNIASQNIERVYDEETKAILSEAEKATERLLKKIPVKLNATEKEAIQAYVSGNLSMEELAGSEKTAKVATLLKEALASGNDAWIQFGASIENAREQFEKTKNAYIDGLEAIDEIYGKAEEDAAASGKTGLSVLGGDDEARKRIENQIKTIQKLQDAYEKLLPFLNEVQMKSTLKSLFPNVKTSIIDSLDFTAELERLAGELERFDKNAAQNLRDTISKDVAGGIADSFKAVEEYRKALDAWKGQDFNLSGKGIAFDISKIISKLQTEYAQIDEKRKRNLELLHKAQLGDEESLKKVREVYGEDIWKEYLENGEATIEALATKERNAAKTVADEKIRDLSKKYVREKLTEKNIDTSDLEDKTIQQVRDLVGRLYELRDEVARKRTEILGRILRGEGKEGDEATVEMLLNVMNQLGLKVSDLGVEINKKIVEEIKSGLDAASKLGDKFSALGSSLDMPEIESLGKAISTMSNDLSGIFELAQKEDIFSIVVGAISMMAEKVVDVFTGPLQQQIALNDATREYSELLNDIRRESHTDIFGTDELGLAAENLSILKESQDKYYASLDAFNKEKIQGYRVAGGWGREGIKKQSVADMLGEISKIQGWDLYLESGELNIAALESYFDSYSERLTKKQRELVQNLIESGNAVDDAAAQQAEYLTNLFSGVADDIATSMVDAFLESGDAATEFGDIAKSVAREMAIDLLKSVLLKPILDEYGAAMEHIMGQSDVSNEAKIKELVNYFNSMLAAVSQVSEDATEMLKPILGQYVGSGADEASSLADGIKGSITEDTAGLLASYINAMRADLSAVRQFQAQHLPIISQSMPTIMDHLARIQANTLNIAASNQSMLNEIISMNERFGDIIDSGNNGSAIKVLM